MKTCKRLCCVPAGQVTRRMPLPPSMNGTPLSAAMLTDTKLLRKHFANGRFFITLDCSVPSLFPPSLEPFCYYSPNIQVRRSPSFEKKALAEIGLAFPTLQYLSSILGSSSTQGRLILPSSQRARTRRPDPIQTLGPINLMMKRTRDRVWEP